MTDYFFKYPFASSGDKTTIPPTTQMDGSVNYQNGYPINYELDLLTNPNALPIERTKFNQLMYATTSNLRQYQTHGIPYWISSADNLGSPFAYDIYAKVRYNVGDPGNEGAGTLIYTNMVQGNTATPGADDTWIPNSYIIHEQLLATDAVPIFDATPLDILYFDLPPGKWLAQGSITMQFTGTTAVLNQGYSWVSEISGIAPDLSQVASGYCSGTPGGIITLTAPITVFTSTVGSPVRIYLTAEAFLESGSATACGILSATLL